MGLSIFLGTLCDDGCTITLYKQAMSIHDNGQEIIKGTRKNRTVIWEVPPGPQQPENVVNNILSQTSKPQLAGIYMQHFSAQIQQVF